jgi:hypothetical protein
MFHAMPHNPSKRFRSSPKTLEGMIELRMYGKNESGSYAGRRMIAISESIILESSNLF